MAVLRGPLCTSPLPKKTFSNKHAQHSEYLSYGRGWSRGLLPGTGLWILLSASTFSQPSSTPISIESLRSSVSDTWNALDKNDVVGFCKVLRRGVEPIIKAVRVFEKKYSLGFHSTSIASMAKVYLTWTKWNFWRECLIRVYNDFSAEHIRPKLP